MKYDGALTADPASPDQATIPAGDIPRAASDGGGSRWWLRLSTYAALALGDAALLAGALLASGAMTGDAIDGTGALRVIAILLSLYFGIVSQRQPYTARFFTNWRRTGRDAAAAQVVAAVVLIIVVALLRVSSPVSIPTLLLWLAIGVPGLILWRRVAYRVAIAAVKGAPVSTVLVIDGAPFAAPPGVRVIDAGAAGLVPDPLDPAALDRLSVAIAGNERVVISCPPDRRADWAATLRGTGALCEIVTPELGAIGVIRSASLAGCPALVVSVAPLATVNRVLKRGFDLAVAGGAVLLLSPLLLVVALAVRLDSPGPVLFRQRRMGRGNAVFDVLKFRSMRAAACDAAGARSTARDDDRITRVGRLIRATSIDELPQLFNVLRGEMSIVGPRPHALGSLAGARLFWEIDPHYATRHAIKPGITGMAQVRGFRGATHTEADLENRLRCDLAYMHRWSIWRDLWIVASTLRVLVHRNAF